MLAKMAFGPERAQELCDDAPNGVAAFLGQLCGAESCSVEEAGAPSSRWHEDGDIGLMRAGRAFYGAGTPLATRAWRSANGGVPAPLGVFAYPPPGGWPRGDAKPACTIWAAGDGTFAWLDDTGAWRRSDSLRALEDVALASAAAGPAAAEEGGDAR